MELTAGPQPRRRRSQSVGAPHPVVLVVEDDDGVRQFVSDALTVSGFAVVRAADAAQALEFMKQQVDVVLTDVIMLGMDGIALAGALAERVPDTPVVLMSASGPPLATQQRWPCISKPFTIKMLVETLNTALSLPCG